MIARRDQYGARDSHKWQLHRVDSRENPASSACLWPPTGRSIINGIDTDVDGSVAAGFVCGRETVLAFAQGPQTLPLGRRSHWIIPGQTPFFTVGFRGSCDAQM